MAFGYVRQSGGYLMIESRAGKGTSITLLMPRDTEIAA
jgi:signal transduction histidine kinase